MKSFLLFLSLCLVLALHAQTTPTITMIAVNPDTIFNLKLSVQTVKTTIQIDWGNGQQTSYVIDTVLTEVKNPNIHDGESTIKIYGQTITTLDCSNDSISSLDVSNCLSLKKLICSNNRLETLNVAQNTNLVTLDCSFNHLTFSDLPLPKSSFLNYTYSPQIPISIKKTLYAGDVINLSAYLFVVDGSGTLHSTLFTWKNGVGETLVQGTDYTLSSPGIFTFSKKPNHIVYCEMTNDLFPDFKELNVHRTSCLNPDGFTLPLAFSFQTAGVSNIILNLIAITDNAPIKIDWGNGILVSSELMFLRKNVENKMVSGTSKTVKVFGEGIKSITGANCGVSTIDITACKTLTSLSLNGNKLIKIDVSKNTQLQFLNLNGNKFSTLDITKNIALQTLYCNQSLLTYIDLSKNTKLEYLTLYDNDLDEIDLAKNPLLKELVCSRNSLDVLDLSGNPLLEKVYCNSNSLDFNTLPAPRKTFSEYEYAPQMFTYWDDIIAGNNIDLSDQYSVTDTSGVLRITNYKWRSGGHIFKNGTDYSVQGGGNFVFTKIPNNLFYCEMTNAAFPDLSGEDALKFGFMMNPALIFNVDALSEFDFSAESAVDTNMIVVHYGSGGYYSYYSLNWVPERDYAYPIEVYGEDIKSFNLTYQDGITSMTFDASNSTTLKTVGCWENVSLNTLLFENSYSIDTIDCYFNSIRKLDVVKVSSLKKLDCSFNDLISLDVTKNSQLTFLDCGTNQLSTLDVSKSTGLTYLSCYNNKLTSIDVTKNTALTLLSVRTNQIKNLDISKNTELTFLSCRDNQLKALDVGKNTKLTELYCYGNLLTIASLPQPQKSYTKYQYAPQANYPIPDKLELNAMVDLSSQLTATDIDNVKQTTIYSWMTSKGVILKKGTDYIENAPGKFEFLSKISDSIYCVMTNQAFPDFTGANAFKTNLAKINYSQDIFTLSVSVNELQLNRNEGSSGSIEITSNTSWNAASNQTWLTVSPTSGTGNGTLTFTASANPSTITRTATVIVSATGVASQTITVTQAAGEANLSVSSNAVTVANEAGSTTMVDNTSNTTWSNSSDQTWLTVSPASGTGNGALTFTAFANPSTTTRTATVTVSAAGVASQTITVTQAAGEANLSVSSNAVTVAKEAGSTTMVDITSNTTWSAGYDQTWLTVSPASGTGNGALTFTASANPSTTTRTATVIVSATGVVSQTITVTQAAGEAILSVSSNMVAVAKEAGSTTMFDITSNTTWSAGSDQTWLTVSPVSGTGNGALTFTASSNPSTTTRTATVTVSATGVASQIIIVTQEAGIGTGVSGFTNESVKLFPNPVTDGFRINGLEGNATLSISDLNGRLQFTKDITGKEYISISSLPNGVYIVRVTNVSGIIEKKLIKE